MSVWQLECLELPWNYFRCLFGLLPVPVQLCCFGPSPLKTSLCRHLLATACTPPEPWSPAEESVHQRILPLSGNYVFYLGDTYSYFNIGHPAVLMGHYSNKWGKHCGVGDPLRATGPSIPAHLLRQGNVYHWHLRRTETKWQAGSAVRSTPGPSHCKHIHLVRLYSCGCQATA